MCQYWSTNELRLLESFRGINQNVIALFDRSVVVRSTELGKCSAGDERGRISGVIIVFVGALLSRILAFQSAIPVQAVASSAFAAQIKFHILGSRNRPVRLVCPLVPAHEEDAHGRFGGNAV